MVRVKNLFDYCLAPNLLFHCCNFTAIQRRMLEGGVPPARVLRRDRAALLPNNANRNLPRGCLPLQSILLRQAFLSSCRSLYILYTAHSSQTPLGVPYF